jgi:chromosome segregation and condensation protein ScpB
MLRFVSTTNRPALNGAMTKTLATITRAPAGVPGSRLDGRHVNHLVRRGFVRVETSRDPYGEAMVFAV